MFERLRQHSGAPALLARHGLSGYLHSRDAQSLPAPLRELCRAHWKTQLANQMAFGRELETLGPVFAQAGISPVLLKGAALAGITGSGGFPVIYDDPAARSMGDVDLLIEGSAFERARSLLLERGYSEVPSLRWEATRFKCLLRRDLGGLELDIELHQRIFFSEGEGPAGLAWRTRELGPHYRTLELEELLAHLLGHLGYQHTFLRLNWLLDIDLLLRRFGDKLDVERFTNLVRGLGHSRSAQAGLWAANRHFGSPLAQALESKLGVRRLAPLWERLLSAEFLLDPEGHPARYYALKHLMKDRMLDALAYDSLWLKARLGQLSAHRR